MSKGDKIVTDVLVDVDDTIADTQVLLIAEINERTGGSYRFEDMDRTKREGLPEDEDGWRAQVQRILKEPDTLAQCKPSPGSLRGMQSLVRNGIRPHIVSARKALLHSTTEKWLAEHGFGDLIEQIHPRTDDERGHEFKVRVSEEVGFAAAFEDTFEVAAALAAVVPIVYLIDKPWNRGHDEELPENVIRTESFESGTEHFIRSTS